MQIATVLLSLPVKEPEVSLHFYREALGLKGLSIDDGIISIELPNLSLFLIEDRQYRSYLEYADVPRPTTVAGAAVISCAMASREEMDAVLSRASSYGGSGQHAQIIDGSYTGYLQDPDGHVWELVYNEITETAAHSVEDL